MTEPKTDAASAEYVPSGAQTQFTYTLVPTTAYVTTEDSHPSYATISLQILNENAGAVACSGIHVSISVGADAASLAAMPGAIVTSSQPNRWTPFLQDDNSWIIMPVPPVTGLAANEALTIDFAGILVNKATGPGQIGIDEYTSATNSITCIVNKIRSPLAITTFAATEPTVDPGGQSTLHWDTTGAYSCTLDSAPLTRGGLRRVEPLGQWGPSGQTDVYPTSSTVYTLTAHGDGPDTSKQAIVAVRTPTVLTFYPDKYIVDAGETINLHFTTRDADECTLQPDGTTLGTSGSWPVTPQQSTNYQLFPSYKGFEGDPFAAFIKVRLVTINSFINVPSLDAPGVATRLEWNVSSAETCAIDHGIGSVNPIDACDIKPTVTTDYQLTATGRIGNDAKTVTVKPPGWFATGLTTPCIGSVAAAGPDRIIRVGGVVFGQSGPTANTNTDIYTDAKGWTSAQNNLPNAFFGTVAYANGNFWLFRTPPFGVTGPAVMSSPDGVKWTAVGGTPDWVATPNRGFAFQNALWIISGKKIWRSADGVAWTLISSAAPFGNTSNPISPWCVTTTDDSFVAGGLNEPLMESSDGVTWKPVGASGADFVMATGAALGVLWIAGLSGDSPPVDATLARNRAGAFVPATSPTSVGGMAPHGISVVTFESRMFFFGDSNVWYLQL